MIGAMADCLAFVYSLFHLHPFHFNKVYRSRPDDPQSASSFYTFDESGARQLMRRSYKTASSTFGAWQHGRTWIVYALKGNMIINAGWVQCGLWKTGG